LAAAPIGKSALLIVAADGHRLAGQVERGLVAVEAALDFARTKEELAWQAEILQLRADLLLSQSKGPQNMERAEKCLLEALEVSRQQSAKMLGLRAAMSLCRARRSEAGRKDARRLLREHYEWFEEGHHLPDLLDAKDLL
jgi:hypothetical protein